MSSPVITVSLYDSAAHARRLMLKHGVSRLVVVDDEGRLAGVLTISDLVEAIAERLVSRGLEAILVKEIYTPDPITIEATRSIKTAAQVMLRHKIGCLPVVDFNGDLVGIITRTDLTRAYAERYKGEYKAHEVMRRDFARARRDHSIFYIMKLIMLDPSGKVIVEDNERPVGVIAKRDIAFLTLPRSIIMRRSKGRILKTKVVDLIKEKVVSLRMYLAPLAEDVMTENPITANLDTDLADIAETMVREGIGVVPIVDNASRLQGVVSKLEILEAITRT